MTAEGLFDALDGRAVSIKGQSWQIEPYAVWDTQGQRWIQMALAGGTDGSNYVLTLKLAAGAGVQHAVMALSSWLANPGDTRDVLNVA